MICYVEKLEYAANRPESDVSKVVKTIVAVVGFLRAAYFVTLQPKNICSTTSNICSSNVLTIIYRWSGYGNFSTILCRPFSVRKNITNFHFRRKVDEFDHHYCKDIKTKHYIAKEAPRYDARPHVYLRYNALTTMRHSATHDTLRPLCDAKRRS